MSRSRMRACLQECPSLNLNWLVRNGLIRRAGFTPGQSIAWRMRGYGAVASGFISADMTDPSTGWLKIWMDEFSQEIALARQSRHFGGGQWYFVCPLTSRKVSVVWKPRGATQFASRYAWPNKVAYLTQFGSWIDRAHLGKAKIKARLLGDSDPEEWDLPPRPRGMRVKTYDRLVARFDAHQSKLDAGLAALTTKWMSS